MRVIYNLVCTTIFIFINLTSYCQVTADFTAPDTVYVGQPINLVNLSQNGTTFYWSFCSGNLVDNPIAENVGNPGGTLNLPIYITCVKDGNNCFSFTTNQGWPSVSRHYHGTSFRNNPISSVNFGSFGLLEVNRVEGIQIKKDNGIWYGFVNNNTYLVRLNFGNSLWNTPTATNIPITGMNLGHGLAILKEGNTWIGFIDNAWGNDLLRLNFGANLSNTPTVQNFGNIANLSHPSQFQVISENSQWYIFIMNNTSNTISRIFFGNSLLNTPTGTNLGNTGELNQPVGITILQDCDSTAGYFTNWVNNGAIGRVTFSGGLGGTVTSTVLPYLTNYDLPHSFSEIIREFDSLFIYVTVEGSSTLKRLVFPPCTNSSIPSSILYTPPPFSYNQVGVYNVRLVVDQGLVTEVNKCKRIVVIANPVIADFIAPDTVCVAQTINITNLTTGGTTFHWNFCAGNANNDPIVIDIGNPQSTIHQPTYLTSIKENNDCFTFVSNQFPPGITRLYHGHSFRNYPITTSNLGSFGLLTVNRVEGIQIKNDNGTWYGFVNNDNTIIRLNFGNSLWNPPTAINLGPISGMNMAHGLGLAKEGSIWIAFIVNAFGNNLLRLNFGSSLANIPTIQNFGNIGLLNHPNQLQIVQQNGLWYILITNSFNNSLSRISFGSSLMNTPSGENLGNIGGFDQPVGLTIITDCNSTIGYYTNWTTNGGIGKLTFLDGVAGSVTGNILPNLNTYNHPHSYSEPIWESDSLIQYITVFLASELLQVIYPPCNDASIPSSTLFNPPAFTYNNSGTYDILLIVNEGQPSQVIVCKQIVVGPLPVPTLSGSPTACTGSTVVYSTQGGMNNYAWAVSTGGTITSGGSPADSSITVTWNLPGSQYVSVNYRNLYGCMGADPAIVNVNVLSSTIPAIAGPDSPCAGSTENVYSTDGGMSNYTWNISPGGVITSGAGTISITVTWISAGPQYVNVIYTDQNGCTAQVPTIYNINVKPLPGAAGNISGPSLLCAGTMGVVYTVSPVANALSYLWSVPIGWTIITGNGTNSITVNFANNASSGTIKVFAINSCGTGQPSPPFPVSVSAMPVADAGPNCSTCQANPFTVTQAAASSYTSVHWNSTGTGVLTDANTLSPTYTPGQAETGPVTLTLIAAGNSPCPDDTSVMILEVGSKPIVDAGNDLITCGLTPLVISGSSAFYYQTLQWTTSGSGFFNDPSILHPVYYPGIPDTANGSVLLYLHATLGEPCPPASDSILLTFQRPGFVNAGQDTAVCQGQEFVLTETIASDNSVVTWSTSGDGTFTDPHILNPVYSPGSSDIFNGNTMLMVTAASIPPCEPVTDTILLTINRKPSANPGADGSICQGMTFPVSGVTAYDFTTFTWEHNGQGNLTGANSLSPIYIHGPGETGTVTLTLKVFGKLSCHDSMASCSMKVGIYTPVEVNGGTDQSISYDSTALLTAAACEGSGNYQYEWEPSSLVADQNSPVTRTVRLKNDTIFIIHVTDKVTGCEISDSITIRVAAAETPEEDCIVFYNVITPNGDGINDSWMIDCIELFPENHLEIFNRWGDRVYTIDHYNNTANVWKGANSEGKLLPDGTYFYVMKIQNLHTFTGWVFLRNGN
ncbi:MAG: gliding motility-associated C-terminal domain-containing protein [Bacteroidetes bacterium]|nr:gliding motility-associated C-terminal domain-containing protein [Bacteroidota bacterium]